jgi:WD40 repeat protein
MLAGVPVGLAALAIGGYFAYRPKNKTTTRGDDPSLWVGPWEFDGKIMQLAIAPDSRTVAVAVRNEDAEANGLIDVRGRHGKSLPGWPKQGRGAEGVAFSPDGKKLAAAYREWGRLQLWDMQSGTEHRIESDDNLAVVSTVAFSANGEWLATGRYADFGAKIQFWQALGDSWQRRHEFTLEEIQVWNIEFVPKSNRLMVASLIDRQGGSRSAIHVLDPDRTSEIPGPTGMFDRQFAGPCFAFASDALLIAVGSLGKVQFFEVPTWTPRGAPIPVLDNGSPADVGVIAMSVDGAFMAIGRNNDVRLVRTSTGEPLATMSKHTRPVTSLAFTHDGRTLLSGGEDGRIWIYDLTEFDP